MKKAVIRNCLHGSEIVVYRKLDDSGRCLSLVKSSTGAEGIRNLTAERDGYRWYNEALAAPVSVLTSGCGKSYFRLEVEFLPGRKPDYLQGLLANAEAIALGIRHYCEVWGPRQARTERACVHGDISLDNLIISGERVRLIDWEHFTRDALPVGFDGHYLLFESLWFEIEDMRDPAPAALALIRRGIATLRDAGCLHPSYADAPLRRTVEAIHSRPDIWGEQLQRCHKLPILKWSSQRIAELDRRIAAPPHDQ